MLKASENFKLIKTVLFQENKTPFFLIEHQGQEYISAGSRFVRNTTDDRSELFKKYPYLEDGFNQLLDSSPVSGWEVLEDGECCFEGCPFEIGVWDIDLPNLVVGEGMFWGCKTLTRLSGNLDSLESGNHMFERSGITVFASDLPSLKSGFGMFDKCRRLTTFRGSLPQLLDGEGMFYSCNHLTVFESPLP